MSFGLQPGRAIHVAPLSGAAHRIPALLTTLLTLLFTADLVAGTCYQLNGEPYVKLRSDDGEWIPCDSSATVSSCCSSKDYCMGNGLCLDAGANNYFSIQGCTDPSWPQPCVTTPECVDNIRDGYSFAFSCRQYTNSSFYHCCGQTAECCNTTSEDDLLRIRGVTSIYRPTLLPTDGSSPETVTVTVTATPSGGTNLAASSGSSSSGSSPDPKTLGIAAGVGGVVGLALVAALVFFGCQMRRKYKWDPHGHAVPISAAAAGVAAQPQVMEQIPPGPAKSPAISQQQTTHSHSDYNNQAGGGGGGGHAGHVSYTGSQLSQGSPYQPQFTSSASTTPVPATAFNYSSQPPAPGGVPAVYQQMGQGQGYEMGGQQMGQGHGSGYGSGGHQRGEVHELGQQQ